MKANRNQQNVITTFMGGVKSARKGGAQLTQEKSASVALATIKTLAKDDGTPLILSAQHADVLKVMFYPKNSDRMSVIKSTLKSAGCTLDETTEELLNRLLTPALLEKKLAKVQTAPPAINWNDMVDEGENSSSSADQGDTVSDDENVEAGDDASEAENAADSTPATAVEQAPVNPTKPTNGKR